MSKTPTMQAPAIEEPTVAPRTHTKPHIDTRSKRQPPYVVIVENDDKHTFTYVIEVLRRICGHSESKAFILTNEIHKSGRAVVWAGTLEVAELKRDKIYGIGPDFYALQSVRFPLGATIEPLSSN